MDSALWLASIFGPVFMIMGLWMLVRTEDLEKLWVSIKGTPSVLYLGGMINLIIGFMILSLYRDWTMSLAVLVTILGYVQVLRGILVLFFHEWLVRFTNKIMKSHMLRQWALLPLVWGFAMTWFAFAG